MTRYLLDTHLSTWMTADRRLGKAARTLIATTDCAVSVASLWEMLIKNAKGKLPLPEGPIHESLEAQGFRALPIHARHVAATREFAYLHDDPFDRLLAATAASEQLGIPDTRRGDPEERSPFVRSV